MAKKKIIYSDTFVKCYSLLSKRVKQKVIKQIKILLSNSRSHSLQIHKIHGTKNIWELYIDKKYRLTFEQDSDTYFFRVVGTHDILKKEEKL
jgi:mRNA-degrading endonuclease RelE of RelBE toxin-antitoxin system